jgi:hypothetical protein
MRYVLRAGMADAGIIALPPSPLSPATLAPVTVNVDATYQVRIVTTMTMTNAYLFNPAFTPSIAQQQVRCYRSSRGRRIQGAKVINSQLLLLHLIWRSRARNLLTPGDLGVNMGNRMVCRGHAQTNGRRYGLGRS